jgi:GcrA cell cycle regulator
MSEWDDDRRALLRKLWNEGLTSTQIAPRMGLTRNGVLGAAHRMGLTRKPKTEPKPASVLRQKRRTASRLIPKPEAAPNSNLPANPPSTHVTSYVAPGMTPGRKIGAEAWLPLRGQKPAPFGEPGVCRWPIEFGSDDVRSSQYWCCGARRDPAESYCTEHARRAGGPAKPTKARAYDFTQARARRAA